MGLAWVMAALLLLPGAGPVATGDQEPDSCTGGPPPESVEGFAPLTVSGSKPLDSSDFSCYVLFIEPAFLFHGRIVVTLSDGVRTASLQMTCTLAGIGAFVPGGPGCTSPTGSFPTLVAGPMTLTVVADDAVLPLGSWKGGVVFGD